MTNKLLKTELFFLLQTPDANEKELEKAYNQFVNKLHSFITSPTDRSTVFFLLNHAKLEIKTISKLEGKNYHSLIIHKTISLLDIALEYIKLPAPLPQTPIKKFMQWTGDKCYLVELIYAIYHTNSCINHGDITLKQITEVFEYVFNVKFQNVSVVYGQIRGRVGERCVFINKMLSNLKRAMSESDK